MTEYLIQITSGVGPPEARRFIAQLAARLECLCIEYGLLVRDVCFHGDEYAPRSMTLRVVGNAPRWLLLEEGTHMLVHRSPARGKSARKRWFASVAIRESPEDKFDSAPIERSELSITACRGGGPGGQNVNKVSSAVRIAHRPSGIGVRVDSERSQKANIEQGIQRLEEFLRAQRDGDRATHAKRHRLTHYRVVRGNPVRSYTLTGDGRLVGQG